MLLAKFKEVFVSVFVFNCNHGNQDRTSKQSAGNIESNGRSQFTTKDGKVQFCQTRNRVIRFQISFGHFANKYQSTRNIGQVKTNKFERIEIVSRRGKQIQQVYSGLSCNLFPIQINFREKWGMDLER